MGTKLTISILRLSTAVIFQPFVYLSLVDESFYMHTCCMIQMFKFFHSFFCAYAEAAMDLHRLQMPKGQFLL